MGVFASRRTPSAARCEVYGDLRIFLSESEFVAKLRSKRQNLYYSFHDDIRSRIPITKYNICYSNFDDKILPDEPIEIIEIMMWFNMGEVVDTFTSDKQFIEKIVRASMEHDYLPAEYDMLLMVVDSVRIIP